MTLKNLTYVDCKTSADALAALTKVSFRLDCANLNLVSMPANRNASSTQAQAGRHTASHNLNERSSRSHTLLTLWIETVDTGVSNKENL